MSTEHELKYRAGLAGFGSVDGPPQWYCTCGQWSVVRDQRGSPFEETARKRHRKHAKDSPRGE